MTVTHAPLQTAPDAPGRVALTRAEFLRLAALGAGFALASCTPARILLKLYPASFDDDAALRDRTLRAFVATVVPGAAVDDPNLVRIFTDDYYPFAAHAPFFAADLCRRAARLFGDDRFDQLPAGQRTAVVLDGLDGDAVAARLYRGAVLLAQVSGYASVYDDDRGCPLIDFDGPNGGFRRDEVCYADNPARSARAATRDGNSD